MKQVSGISGLALVVLMVVGCGDSSVEDSAVEEAPSVTKSESSEGKAGEAKVETVAEKPVSAQPALDDNSIVGKWEINQKNQHFTVIGFDEYRADGTLSSNGTFIMEGEGGPRAISVTSEWRLEDGKLYTKVVDTNSPDLSPVGAESVETVKSIDAHEAVLISSGGAEWKMKRVK